MGRLLPWLTLLILLALAGAAAGVWAGLIVVPRHFDPWARLDLRAEPDWLTGFRLSRLTRDPEECRGALGETGLRFTPLPDRPSDENCALSGVVRVTRSDVSFSSGFIATCGLAAAWTLFEANALQPAAQRHFGQRVARVEHLGTYACRNVYGRADGQRSEHATANAIDLAAFVLADGTRIGVLNDWNAKRGSDRAGERKAAFLRDVRDGACRFFDVVLGPDYNEAHRNHFHMDMGAFRSCR
ncbi:extensin [Azospirillum sp. TSH100]|uniref:extensin-like domain-containing protein n=1 Tax=Azospirillum sp. TSH100 TaxID=652764 RepID=UPI000D61C584|nr:extensin family protein [Azospirillum sp. TSH100]PWC85257.1 extensin [Azospirillum sp. TSH100]QCG88820.1 extensin family protein [Azospirillum sp. TSH100]